MGWWLTFRGPYPKCHYTFWSRHLKILCDKLKILYFLFHDAHDHSADHILQTSHILNILHSRNPTLSTSQILDIPHPEYPKFQTFYISNISNPRHPIFLTLNILNVPYLKHPGSQISHILNIPHCKPSISQTFHILPENRLQSIHLSTFFWFHGSIICTCYWHSYRKHYSYCSCASPNKTLTLKSNIRVILYVQKFSFQNLFIFHLNTFKYISFG